MPQVGFKDQKLIRRLKVETRLNPVVNRLNGTKREEAHPDLAAEREAYEKEACTHFCAWHLFNGACDRGLCIRAPEEHRHAPACCRCRPALHA